MNHITIRLIRSPSEGLDVQLLGGQAGSLCGAADALGPRLGAADVDVTLGKVRDPVPQRSEVVDALETGAEPRARGPPVPGKRYDVQPPFACDHVEFPAEERLVGVAVQQDGLARRVGEALGQGAQRRDADSGSDEGDLATGPGAGA